MQEIMDEEMKTILIFIIWLTIITGTTLYKLEKRIEKLESDGLLYCETTGEDKVEYKGHLHGVSSTFFDNRTFSDPRLSGWITLMECVRNEPPEIVSHEN